MELVDKIGVIFLPHMMMMISPQQKGKIIIII